MRKALLLLIAFQICLIGQMFSVEPQSFINTNQPQNSATSRNGNDFHKILGNAIAKYLENTSTPGVAVAVFDGKEGYVMSFGYADKKNKEIVKGDTIFEIGSITKVFTSTDLALQVLNKHMELGDSVTLYFPSLRNATGPIKQITLLDLATHYSRLPRDAPRLKNGQKYNSEKITDFLKNWKVNDFEERKFLYSNLGFGVLGYALGNLVGRTYEEVISTDITQPLGMNSTMVNVPSNLMQNYAQGYNKEGIPVVKNGWNSAVPGGGALRSTANDMLLFLKANLGIKGPSNLINAMRFAQKGYIKVNDRMTMGLGWQRFEAKHYLIIDKNGGVPGFSSYIGMIPEKKVGIVILANKGKAGNTALGRLLLQRLADLVD